MRAIDRHIFRLVVTVFSLIALKIVEGKPCLGTFSVALHHADGSASLLYWGSGGYNSTYDLSIALQAGDTLRILRSQHGNCTGTGAARVRRSTYPDTANSTSTVIAEVSDGTALSLAERGSFFFSHVGSENFFDHLRITISMELPPTPIAVGVQISRVIGTSGWFPQLNPSLVTLSASDTCLGPCLTVYLSSGQQVRATAFANGYAQEGGNAIVRFAPDDEPFDMGIPPSTIPLVGSEGFLFSQDGTYLISFEGPMFTTSGLGSIRVSHSTPPRVDMSLTIERADGTVELVANENQNSNSILANISLGPGDSLRVDHHEITEPCTAVRLVAYESPNWGPIHNGGTQVLDTSSTLAGVRLATPGSYRLQHVTDCGVPTQMALVTINAPEPFRDLVLSLHRTDGSVHELFRSHEPQVPEAVLEVQLNTGDSISARIEQTGWCYSPWYMSISRTSGPEELGSLESSGNGLEQVHWMSHDSWYRILLHGGTCYSQQVVLLHVTHTPVIGVDLQIERSISDGSTLAVAYAEAGGPTSFTQVVLAEDDSITVRAVSDFDLCADLALMIHHSQGDTTTLNDPYQLISPLPDSGITFREVGALLLTLEDSCGTITASAHLNVSTDISTGVVVPEKSRSIGFYINGHLHVRTEDGGQLQIRNAAGQLVYEAAIPRGIDQHSIPLHKEANGVYIATLYSASHVDVLRFVLD